MRAIVETVKNKVNVLWITRIDFLSRFVWVELSYKLWCYINTIFTLYALHSSCVAKEAEQESDSSRAAREFQEGRENIL